MKKIYLGILLAVILGLTLSSDGYCAWPINRTRPIEGRITDATTGKPIERVIVMGVWRKEEIIGINLGGPRTYKIGYEYSVTDKDGRYRLPAKISFHIRTGFDSLSLTIMHPLYEQKKISGFYLKLHRSKEWIYRNERNEKIDLVPKGGIIYYNISLLSLEEKFGINPSIEVARKFDNYFRNTFLTPVEYFSAAKKLEILDNDFLEVVVAKLLLTINKFPDCKDKFRAKELIELITRKYMQ